MAGKNSDYANLKSYKKHDTPCKSSSSSSSSSKCSSSSSSSSTCKSDSKRKTKRCVVTPTEIASLTVPITSPTVVLSGADVPITVSVPNTLAFGSLIISNITPIGSANPILAFNTVVAGVSTTLLVTCGPTTGITLIGTPGAPAPFPSGATTTSIDLFNLPILGAVAGSISASQPVTSGESIAPAFQDTCGSIILSGLIDQTLSFTAVTAATDDVAAAVATVIVTNLTNTFSDCLSASVFALGGDSLIFFTAVAGLFGLPAPVVGDTLLSFFTTLLSSPLFATNVTPAIQSDLNSRLSAVPVNNFPIPQFPFSIPIVNAAFIPESHDIALPTARSTASFLRINPVSVTLDSSVNTPVTVAVNTTGSTTTPILVQVLPSEVFAAFGVNVFDGAVLSAPFTANGISIIPAVTVTDLVTGYVTPVVL